MKEEKEKWIDKVLMSLEGGQKARPERDLFSSIEKRIQNYEANTIPVSRLVMAAAAVVLLIMLNIAVVKKSVSTKENNVEEKATYSSLLISDFNLL
ncbi:hypothetical protein [Neptunitalea chrysea]|uniref:hypothetical protein n=1 Tax=Neptunitalea chrysea TaxID=1647581 RepID=UPI002492EC7F|nr:hypothetical protein [Neptunitalea chrysea]